MKLKFIYLSFGRYWLSISRALCNRCTSFWNIEVNKYQCFDTFSFAKPRPPRADQKLCAFIINEYINESLNINRLFKTLEIFALKSYRNFWRNLSIIIILLFYQIIHFLILSKTLHLFFQVSL